MYQLIKCYNNPTPFMEAVLQSFERTKSDGGWKMLYLAELLYHFSSDGENIATQALWLKYETLYEILMKKTYRPRGFFHVRDDFAMLCEVLAEDKAALVKIVEDIGRLYREKTFYNGFDFDWLYESKGKPYLQTLKKQAIKSENIEEYLRVGKEYQNECDRSRKNRGKAIPKKGIALSIWLQRKADNHTRLGYVEEYLKQSDPQARAEALAAFSRCPYPENPSPIIEDTKSCSPELKEAAWQALANIRHPLVQEYAFGNLTDDIDTILPVCIKNYQEKYSFLLERIVKSIPVDFEDTTGWHKIHLNVLKMIDDGFKAPAPLLLHIYETTYCSCCREHTIRQMGRRRMLTNEILQECLLDSNEDIRIYARQCLKRRKAPKHS